MTIGNSETVNLFSRYICIKILETAKDPNTLIHFAFKDASITPEPFFKAKLNYVTIDLTTHHEEPFARIYANDNEHQQADCFDTNSLIKIDKDRQALKFLSKLFNNKTIYSDFCSSVKEAMNSDYTISSDCGSYICTSRGFDGRGNSQETALKNCRFNVTINLMDRKYCPIFKEKISDNVCKA